jgi:hypothetical protein
MTDTKPTEKKADPQKVADKEQEQGFRGLKVDPLPNSAYSLESGPDSPDAHGYTQVDIADIQKKGA